MSLETARRLSETLMALAFIQQALEHLSGNGRDRGWFGAQLGLALLALAGLGPVLTLGLLLLVSLATIRHFDGPYNGGSDRMRLLVLLCLWASHVGPAPTWPRVALGYLAAQVVLSYAMAGWVKLVNPAWRRGDALRDVLAFSVYPVSEGIRAWAGAPRALTVLSWATIGFEVLFPVALIHPAALGVALAVAFAFHLGNALVFGLNRFVWIWTAGYPVLLWFQRELIAGSR